jgi:hypothetical protein
MSENQNEAVEPQVEEQEQATAEAVEENKPVSQSDDGVIRVNLGELNKPQEDAVPEQKTDEVDVDQPTASSEEVVEEIPQGEEPVQDEQPVQDVEENILEEIIEEQVEQATEQLTDDVADAIAEQKESGIELPENIQKVVDFMNETGGSLEDYVKLNTDYSSLNENQLLREYYESTRPHLDKEEIDFLMEDNFSYDEDLDEERDIRKKKIARKEELAKAKNYLDGLKSKYYEEIKSGSKLNPDQQKAVEFFNRYKEEQTQVQQEQEKQTKTFLQKTDSVFNQDFKGFDYSVGDKKYRFKVKDPNGVKENQSNINNFVKKFLNDKNEMVDAKGYHKSLFTAMNADAIANHFYEQGKADAIKDSIARSKNVDMNPRGSHEKVTASNGWTVRSVTEGSVSGSRLKIKTRK